MLSKKKRLNLKRDFAWVAKGDKLENNFFKIFFRLGENTAPKVGIALSKTTFRKAVGRNRARRLTSKGFENLHNNLLRSGNYVVIPKFKVLELDSEKVTDQIKELLKRKELIDGKNISSNY